jgi:hypothetical protein
MDHHVLTPCPTCGNTFDFPVTRCVTFVAETLLATSDGNCPMCGTRVVKDGPDPRDSKRHDPLAEAATPDEVRAVPVVDLPLSVHCRNLLNKMGVTNFGNLLDMSILAVCDRLGTGSNSAEEVRELVRQHKISSESSGSSPRLWGLW